VSRLNGHSSSTGGARVNERDCVLEYEAKLVKAGTLSADAAKQIWDKYRLEAKNALEQVRGEPYPEADTIHQHTFYEAPSSETAGAVEG
jgi:2-oxoisovalerate dehydrogenase E1 component alpha subunit